MIAMENTCTGQMWEGWREMYSKGHSLVCLVRNHQQSIEPACWGEIPRKEFGFPLLSTSRAWAMGRKQHIVPFPLQCGPEGSAEWFSDLLQKERVGVGGDESDMVIPNHVASDPQHYPNTNVLVKLFRFLSYMMGCLATIGGQLEERCRLLEISWTWKTRKCLVWGSSFCQ